MRGGLLCGFSDSLGARLIVFRGANCGAVRFCFLFVPRFLAVSSLWTVLFPFGPRFISAPVLPLHDELFYGPGPVL